MIDDMDNALAELDVLRDFIDFVNSQVGVYCDSLAGFQGNKARVETQRARVQKRVQRLSQDGSPEVMWVSMEDPNSPDVLHHRIARTDDYIEANTEAGFNEQQLCWSIIVFLFACWDEEIRPKIATIRGVKANEIMIDAFGDLRILRKNIIHNGGVISANDFAKLKVMSEICASDTKFTPTHEQMNKVFVSIKQAIGELILQYAGHLPGAPDSTEIVGIAIQRGGKN